MAARFLICHYTFARFCSRQSVIYSLHSLWKDKNFTVTLCHSILGGGTDCEMRIEVDR